MCSVLQNYLGALTRTSSFLFFVFVFLACSRNFKKYFYEMSHHPYCVTISDATHSGQRCVRRHLYPYIEGGTPARSRWR